MIVSIHQPSYFPWLGLLHKIAHSDVFLVLDDVQFSDSGFQNRNLLLTAEGKAKYLSIPINRKDYLKRPLRELEIADGAWRKHHWNFICNGYRRHPYFAEISSVIEKFYSAEYTRLVDAVVASMEITTELFGIGTRVIRQSEIAYDKSLRRSDLVVDLAKKSGADCYLSGTGAQDYLNEVAFTGGISLRYDRFEHPVYPQKNSAAFISGLCSLDVLFNIGPNAARLLLVKETET